MTATNCERSVFLWVPGTTVVLVTLGTQPPTRARSVWTLRSAPQRLVKMVALVLRASARMPPAMCVSHAVVRTDTQDPCVRQTLTTVPHIHARMVQLVWTARMPTCVFALLVILVINVGMILTNASQILVRMELLAKTQRIMGAFLLRRMFTCAHVLVDTRATTALLI